MKFVSFSTAAIPRPHLGLVQDNEVLDIDLAAHALTIIGPDQMQDLIGKYETWRPLLQSIMNKVAGRRFSEVTKRGDSVTSPPHPKWRKR